MLLVDVRDEGTDSVSDIKGVEVLEVESWADIEELPWYLKDNPKKFKTVIIDTITNVQTLRVEDLVGVEVKGKLAGDWGTITKQDWGTIAGSLKKFITDMRALDLEVVFLAQDRTFNVGDEETDEGGIDPEVGPRLSPSVASHLCAAVHMVGNTFIRIEDVPVKDKKTGKTRTVRRREYCIRLGPNPYYITKLRKPKQVNLPDYLANPTFDDIIDLVQGD